VADLIFAVVIAAIAALAFAAAFAVPKRAEMHA
jgi:uncharacterized membrane protein YjjB (DUF3815 family)